MADAPEHANIPRRVVEELVDVLVFAPVGLASTVLEELPGLVEKGRNRLTVARTIGQFAVVMGRQRIGQAMSERTHRSPAEAHDGPAKQTAGKSKAASRVHEDGGSGAAHGGGDHESTPGGAGDDDLGTGHEQGTFAGHDGTGEGPDATGLAIPGYDSLAASQVVQRLAGLSADELDAVRRYEESTRGRRTILGRISQLSNDRGEPEE
jgi:hypothetical protein